MRITSAATLAALACLVTVAPAAAQEQVFRTMNAVAGKQQRIALIGEVRDCKAGAWPEVKVVTPPKNGTLTVRSFKTRPGTIRNCPQLEAPAQIIVYSANANFNGADEVVYEVKRANGRLQSFTVKIDVSAKPKADAKPGDATDL